MRFYTESLIIELQTRQEIEDFYNIIMFALDWQAYALENDKSKMLDNELKMAKELSKRTDIKEVLWIRNLKDIIAIYVR